MKSWVFNIFNMVQPITVVVLTDEQIVFSLASGSLFKDPSSLQKLPCYLIGHTFQAYPVYSLF